jgi:hypothetical protein
MNPPRAKGTKGETELLRLLNAKGFSFVRRGAGARTDLRHVGSKHGGTYQILATRPDKGRWLFVLDLDALTELLAPEMDNIDIEVKRRKKFAHHTLYEDEIT